MDKFILICDTVNCANEGIPIVLETDASSFSCGPCGEIITNVTLEAS